MNICLIGSLRDTDRIREIAGELKQRGHRVHLPMDTSEAHFADRMRVKAEFMKAMFEQISVCEAVLAVNDRPRGGIEGYIGPNTFLQLGMAMALGKSLFALRHWSPQLPYKEELDAMGITLLDLRLPF